MIKRQKQTKKQRFDFLIHLDGDAATKLHSVMNKDSFLILFSTFLTFISFENDPFCIVPLLFFADTIQRLLRK